MPASAQPPTGVAHGRAARLFGYDIFISFALGAPPRGSRSYASDLARRLRERDYTVFFSEVEAPAGGQLDSALKAALRRSRILVVVANRGTLAEPRWVRVEVETFRRMHPDRPVIPVSIGGALVDPELGTSAQEWLQFADRIWVDDTQAACDQGIASEQTVERLVTAPTAMRASTRWSWTVRAAFAVLAGATAAALWFAWSDRRNAELALANETQAVANAASATANADLARRNELRAVDSAASAVRESERALRAEGEARREAEVARAAERRALAGRLAAESQLARESDPRLAMLLAREAWATDGTPEARRALFAALDEPVALPLAAGLGELRRVTRSADGRFVAASGSNLRQIHLWRFDSSPAPTVASLKLDQGVEDIAFSPDGRTLASIDAKGRLQLWDPERGAALGAPLQDAASNHGWALAWHPNGRIVAVGTSGHDGRQLYAFWDVVERRPAGEPLRTEESYGVFKIAFSPRGERFAATVAGRVQVWDLQQRQLVVPPIPTREATRFVAFTGEDRLVFDGPGYEATAWILWNNSAEKPTYGHANWVAAFAHSPAAGLVATGGEDRVIRVWNADHASPVGRPLVLHEWGVSALAFSPDGRELVSAGREGRVVRWLLDTGSHRYRVNGWRSIERGNTDLTLSEDQRWAVLLVDGRLEWRDTQTGASQAAGERVVDASEGMAVARDGTLALRLRTDRIALHPRGQAKARCMTDKAAGSVLFSADGHWFATSRLDDPALRLWRTADCRAVTSVPRTGENAYFRPFAFAADGRGLWVADDQAVRRWDIGAGRFDAAPRLAVPRGNSLAVDPQGRYLAVAHNDGLTTLVELRAGGRSTTLFRPHGQTTVRALAFSPGGEWLATAADDGRTALWDLAAGQPAGPTIATGQGQLRRIGFSADGKMLLTGGTDPPAMAAWVLDPQVWAARACEAARRNMSCAEWQRVMGPELPYRRTCEAWPWPDDAKACVAPTSSRQRM
jgi:WD40 repeat protein